MDVIAQITKRRDGIQMWLDDEAPFTAEDQKHLEGGTPERAYWHHGYMMALNDVLKQLQRSTNKERP